MSSHGTTGNDEEHVDAHLDDPDVRLNSEDQWGEPTGRTPPSTRRLDALISVRFTADEEQRIRQEARRRGMSLSAFVRESVLARSKPEGHSRAVVVQSLKMLTFAEGPWVVVGDVVDSSEAPVEPTLIASTD
jgi:hypothetical protein